MTRPILIFFLLLCTSPAKAYLSSELDGESVNTIFVEQHKQGLCFYGLSAEDSFRKQLNERAITKAGLLFDNLAFSNGKREFYWTLFERFNRRVTMVEWGLYKFLDSINNEVLTGEKILEKKGVKFNWRPTFSPKRLAVILKKATEAQSYVISVKEIEHLKALVSFTGSRSKRQLCDTLQK